MGELSREVKDLILVETFASPIFLGLAIADDAGNVGREETDAGYKRMPLRFTAPQGERLRYVMNAEPIIFPAYDVDALAPVAYGLLSHDPASGLLIWTERLEKPRQLLRGDRVIFDVGDIRVGLP